MYYEIAGDDSKTSEFFKRGIDYVRIETFIERWNEIRPEHSGMSCVSLFRCGSLWAIDFRRQRAGGRECVPPQGVAAPCGKGW
ncbi:MAG: hypothetical protein NC307_13815 [Roseburia sp.]|nr:hypothetical protein [Roseburia sp.]